MDAETEAILDRIEARAQNGKASPYTPDELRALDKLWGTYDTSKHAEEINRWLDGLHGR